MQDKHKDLKSTQQRKIIFDLLDELNKSSPHLYYLSTTEIATQINAYIALPGNLDREQYLLVKDLSRRDIQIILSLHKR